MQFFAEGNGTYILAAILLGIVGGVGFFVYTSKTQRRYFGNIVVPCVFIALALLFYVITLSFPEEEAGPSAIPHLWILILIVLSIFLLIQAFIGKMEPDPKSGRLDVLLLFIGSTVAYLLIMQFIGYYLSTFLFLILVMYFLSYRKHLIIFSVSGGWLLFAYLVFQRMLYIPLPQGKFIEMILE